MSFHTFFAFSTGLTAPRLVPVGTKARLLAHVEEVERTLGLKRATSDSGAYWDHWDPAYRAGFPDVDDEVLCQAVDAHNALVRRFYADLQEWAETPPADGETLTPEGAAEFWHGLVELQVEPGRWTRAFYTKRMEHLYEVMRGRESEGVTLDAKALTPVQAAAVIRIFDGYLDSHDCRLDVPHGHDHLASSYDGGYDWCGTCCRAMIWEDARRCRRHKCELKEEEP